MWSMEIVSRVVEAEWINLILLIKIGQKRDKHFYFGK